MGSQCGKRAAGASEIQRAAEKDGQSGSEKYLRERRDHGPIPLVSVTAVA